MQLHSRHIVLRMAPNQGLDREIGKPHENPDCNDKSFSFSFTTKKIFHNKKKT